MKTENTNPKSPGHIDDQILTGNNREPPKGHNCNAMAARDENVFNGRVFNAMAARDGNVFEGNRLNAMAGYNRNAFACSNANIIACKFDNVITLTGTGNMVMAAAGSKFKGKKGNAVCMVDFDEYDVNIKAAVIDGEILREDTWYTFENDEFIEVKYKHI